ncbi:MAG: hypothetical protein NT012_00280 [Candidatus Nealsonbacteria bacterium]|nr:hypothetical protein [Candidatus Nealsonbacteria bacterium]
MLSKEALDAFKKQYKEEHGKELSDDEALAIALHENAILHTQKFIPAIEKEIGEIDSDTKSRLAEDISSFFLSLIFIYLGWDKKFDNLRPLVLKEYEKFIKDNSGAINEGQGRTIHNFLIDKLRDNIMWLSTPFEKRAVVDKIASAIKIALGVSGRISRFGHDYKPIVELFVYNTELSMYHFGIISEATNKGKLFY